jgi:hypothetical protein
MKKIKKYTLIISFIGAVLFLALFFNSDALYKYCYKEGHCIYLFKNVFNSESFIFPLFISLLILLFSVATYFLREEIFTSWFRFARVWVPLSIILVIITPGGSGGGFMPSLIDKELTAFLMAGLFLIISTLIIIIKSIKVYRK